MDSGFTTEVQDLESLANTTGSANQLTFFPPFFEVGWVGKGSDPRRAPGALHPWPEQIKESACGQGAAARVAPPAQD